MDAWGFSDNQETYGALVGAYESHGRHYHNQEHVSACLEHLDGVNLPMDSRKEIEIALWFHDSVYKPFSARNERDSADWAKRFLGQCDATDEQVSRVHRLIMVTEHDAPTITREEAILVDIDLAILGAEPDIYDLFEKGVRREYRLVPYFLYRKKRVKILSAFLERTRIYTSSIFTEDRERQARQNMTLAISSQQFSL